MLCKQVSLPRKGVRAGKKVSGMHHIRLLYHSRQELDIVRKDDVFSLCLLYTLHQICRTGEKGKHFLVLKHPLFKQKVSK